MTYRRTTSYSFILVLSISIIFSPHSTNANASISVEERVREAFKSTPVMIEIARCESKFRQFTDSGAPLRGPGGMVGVFQFYEAVHSAPAHALGFDITTLEGNINYAKYVFEAQGTSPWKSAESCWDTHNTSKDIPSQAELQAKIATLQKLIATLSQLLALQNQQVALRS